MRVLLDENLPRRLKSELVGHEVVTVPEIGWSGATDADILRGAATRFDALVTADRNLEFQQNVAAAGIGVVVILAHDTRIQTLRSAMPAILAALEAARPGVVLKVEEA